jgi:hypothetical protein
VLAVPLVTIVVGTIGIVHPDSLTATRRSYFATPGRQHVAAAIRLLMGLVVVVSAARSRWPALLRVLGTLMCLQAVSATLMGAEHARTVLEWETMHPALLRVGAIVALVSGGFMALAVTTRSSADRTASEL